MVNIKEYIINTINSKQYKNIFYNKTSNRKYDIDLLLDSIIYILKNGISYRAFINMISIINNTNNDIKFPYYTTIYKFYNKLIKYNIINITYTKLVNKYINKNKCNKFIMDSTFITNKLGIDYIGFNKLIPKHKTSKISLITDIKGIPININLSKGNINDAKIILHQLDNLQNNVNIKNNNNIFIGDAAYDSNNIRNKLNELKLGYLIADKNKRNTKNKDLIDSYKLNDQHRELLKKRYKIEITNNKLKQYKRINVRYDKLGIYFINFIYLAAIGLIPN